MEHPLTLPSGATVAADPPPAVELRGVVRHQGSFTLGPLDLLVPTGSVTGFVGPNGAGKTTTLRTILGMVHTASGTTTVLGAPPGTRTGEVGVVLEDATLPPTWDARAAGRALARFHPAWDDPEFSRFLRHLHVPERTPVKGLSRGERTKLGLALALAHRPRLLVLDEPTGGLDPVARDTVLGLCRDFMVDPTHTILFSTHLTEDLERLADRLVVIDGGCVVLEGTTPDLLESHALVHCPTTSLSPAASAALIGATASARGVTTGLIRTDDTALFGPDALIEAPRLDDIVVCLCRDGDRDGEGADFEAETERTSPEFGGRQAASTKIQPGQES